MRRVDGAVGALLRAVDLERTAVVLLADHGEAFGEHRRHGHGSTLYDPQARIPLLLSVPGLPPSEVDTPVAAIDATTTLLVLGGADASATDGLNLLPLAQGRRTSSERPIFLELHRYLSSRGTRTADLKGVVLGDWKLVVDRKRDTAALYDLRSDPNERRNRLATAPERAALMRGMLDAFVHDAERDRPLP